jgi:Ni,Fe-hydrogenase I large subunit
MPTYSPDDFCIADLDTVVSAVSHYLDALQMQAKAKKLSALFGGKQPHQSGIIPGGVTALPSSSTRALFGEMLAEQASFIRDVYVQDVLTLGTGPLLALATSDVGVGHQNYLSFGGFPQGDGSFLYPQGALVDGALVATSRDEIEPVLSEDISGAWYASPSAGHPSASEQSFDLAKPDAYSFVKAPRFQGHPMEVGPLARMMVALQRPEHPTNSHEAVRTFADLVDQGVQPGAVARHAARALETIILCDAMKAWLDELEALAGSSNTVEIHDTQHWDPPSTGIGFGLTEAPRGSLGHWVEIAGKKISHYACVVPTTWNASPTDQQGIRGPFEQALLGCPVPDANNPINVGRVLRSFDPCMACAVHLITPSRDATRFAIESGLREK